MEARERCRNCGALAGPAYCGACGQKLRERRGPFYGMVRDALAEFFALDGALARTLRALAVPGKLTREFLAGRRAAYLRPVRLYAIASLALFSSVLSLRTPDAASVNFYINGELVTPAPAIRGGTSYTIDTENSRLLRLVLGDSWNDLDHLRGRPAQELLDAIFDGLRRILPLSLIAFVPFLALALRIVSFRRSVLFVDHLVFAMHVQSATFLSMALTWLLARVLSVGPMYTLFAYMGVGVIGAALYMPLALKRTYGQGWPMTLLKAGVLVVLYLFLLQVVLGLSMATVILQL